MAPTTPGIGKGSGAVMMNDSQAARAGRSHMNAPWRIEMLGGLRATQGEQVVARFQTRKTGALLAYLAYHGHRPHPREELIELLWPECDPRAGHDRLKTALSSLRRQLEPPDV